MLFATQGKYIKLQYGADWKLGGARTLPFLLEKSRLVHQEQNERNYHVFYQLCRGVSAAALPACLPACLLALPACLSARAKNGTSGGRQCVTQPLAGCPCRFVVVLLSRLRK